MPTLALDPRAGSDPLFDGYTYLLGELRAELARHRISQTALAPVLGLSQPEISARLSGRILFRYLELMRLADALGLSMADLARWSEGPDGARAYNPRYTLWRGAHLEVAA